MYVLYIYIIHKSMFLIIYIVMIIYILFQSYLDKWTTEIDTFIRLKILISY